MLLTAVLALARPPGGRECDDVLHRRAARAAAAPRSTAAIRRTRSRPRRLRAAWRLRSRRPTSSGSRPAPTRTATRGLPSGSDALEIRGVGAGHGPDVVERVDTVRGEPSVTSAVHVHDLTIRAPRASTDDARQRRPGHRRALRAGHPRRAATPGRPPAARAAASTFRDGVRHAATGDGLLRARDQQRNPSVDGTLTIEGSTIDGGLPDRSLTAGRAGRRPPLRRSRRSTGGTAVSRLGSSVDRRELGHPRPPAGPRWSADAADAATPPRSPPTTSR